MRDCPHSPRFPKQTRAARFELLRKQHEKELGPKAPLPATAATVMEVRKQKGQEIPYAAANDELVAALLAKDPATEAELGRAGAGALRGDPRRVAGIGPGRCEARIRSRHQAGRGGRRQGARRAVA